MHPVIERRLFITLSVVCVVEIAVAAMPWLIDPARMLGGPAAATRSAGMTASSPLDEVQPPESFASFTARPLFTANRRPPPSALASRGETGAPFQQGQVILGRYRLTGIVVTPKVRMAFVTDLNGNKSITITEGEKLGEWVFTEITRDSITMQAGGRRNVVALRAPAAPSGGGR